MTRLPLAALLAATTIASAQAGPVTFSASVGGVSDLANPTYFHFDAMPPGITTTFSGDGGIVTGSTVAGDPPPGHAAPYLSNNQGTVFAVSPANGPQTSPYLSTGVGTATISFAASQTAFGILIGSGDDYNTVSFESAGTTLETFSGTDLFGSPTGDRGPNGTEWFNFHSTVPFDAVALASSDYALEAGAAAILSSTHPIIEPASGSLLLAGLGMLALARKTMGDRSSAAP